MSTHETTPQLLGAKYPAAMGAQDPGVTAMQKLAMLVERHDVTESIRERQAITEGIRAIRTDVHGVDQRNVRLAQEHIRKRAEVIQDMRAAVDRMHALAASTDPISDDSLADLDEWEDLSRRMTATADRLISEASWIAAKLEDPLKMLSDLQSRFPTLKKSY